MHIKFLSHRQGAASDAVRYLLQAHDHTGDIRAEVRVLRGDPRNRAEITAHIEALAAEGLVTNAQDVRQELAQIGEITRADAVYVSVRLEGTEKPIQLRGELFRDD